MNTGTTYIEHVHLVPDWMLAKVVKIAKDRKRIHGLDSFAEAVSALEYEAAQQLKADIVVFPDLGESVPPYFLQALRVGVGNNLSPLERALIVLIVEDSTLTTPENVGDVLREYLSLKWHALADLLESEGGY